MSAPLERPRRIVVVGNGIAGLTTADSLRDNGFDGELTIVGEERHSAYSRPALSKALLKSMGDLTAHELPPTTHGATELLGVRATSLDSERGRVRLDSGDDLPYDRLVIATGSRARRVSATGDEITVRCLDDAVALRERLTGRPDVLIVGGGPLGMELASGCLASGCRVTVVSQGLPLAEQLGVELAGAFVAAARDQGLKIVETARANLEHSGGSTRVVLAEGMTLRAPLVISAVGDVPNTEWLAGSGLATAGPLTVDGRGLLTPRIAAVGDLAVFPTRLGLRRIPLWHSAIEQSKVAGAALLMGADAAPLEFQPYFWTEGFGLSLKAVGFLPAPGEPEVIDAGADGGSLLRWPGAAAALNYRIPIPRLRRLINTAA